MVDATRRAAPLRRPDNEQGTDMVPHGEGSPMETRKIEMAAIEGAGGFWRAIGMRAVGTSIVAAVGAGGPRGFLALSPTHLCPDPPTIMVSVDIKTSALAAIRESRRLSINYLSAQHADLVPVFSGKTALKGADRFKNIDWQPLPSGAPGLLGSVCVLDCRVEEMIERHATMIVIARIDGAYADPEKSPLISFKGKTAPLAFGPA
jgi:flavin reductase (DIM6/NTAB) family NADH-FMN oxidoreductase RutF